MTPNTDSVAVLREVLTEARQVISADRHARYATGYKSTAEHDALLAKLDAALSAQGEAYCYVGIGPMRGRPRDGTDDVRWYYESPAAAEYHGCHTIFPLYTAPGGVGDAVTEAYTLDMIEDAWGATVPYPRNYFDQFRVALSDAALAARTGKGEA